MKKLQRLPKPKEGELICRYGKLPDDDPDICYLWGSGARDSRLLHFAFTCVSVNDEAKYGQQDFVSELKRRGYDITTFKFSIQKITPPPPQSKPRVSGEGKYEP